VAHLQIMAQSVPFTSHCYNDREGTPPLAGAQTSMYCFPTSNLAL